MIEKASPLKARFIGAAMNRTARRNGSPSVNLTPSTSSLTGCPRGSVRSCCKGLRISHTPTKESR